MIEKTERDVKKYSFLKGEKVTIESIYYEVKDVFILETKKGVEPFLKAIQINKDGSAKEGYFEVNIPIDDYVKTSIGVYILEAFSLKYSENNCFKLRDLIKEIHYKVPPFERELGINQKLKIIGENMICDPEFAQVETEFYGAIKFIKDNLSQCI